MRQKTNWHTQVEMFCTKVATHLASKERNFPRVGSGTVMVINTQGMVVEYHGNLGHKVTKTEENAHIRGSKYTQTYMKRFKHEKSNSPGRKSDHFLLDICHQAKPE